MRANVSRSKLFLAMSHSIGIVDKKPAVPVLSHVLLIFEDKQITIKATDLDHSFNEAVEAQVETFGSIAVHGQMFFDIIRKFSEESVLELYIADQGKKLVIASERSRFEMQTISANDFPAIDQFTATAQFSLPSVDLKRLIDFTKFAMAVEETRYNLNGIYMHIVEDTLKAAATDGHRLAVTAIPAKDCKLTSGIYSRKTILEIRKLLDETDREIQISTDNNRVQFKVENVTLTARFVDGTFPNYAAVIPAIGDNFFEVNRKDFISSLDLVSVISDDKSRTVKLELKTDTLCLSSINVTTGGNGKDEISVKKSTEEPWDACFNARYLLDIADAVQCERLKIYYTGRLNSILVLPEDNASQFVVMPMRI